jgi:hypothetical protein
MTHTCEKYNFTMRLAVFMGCEKSMKSVQPSGKDYDYPEIMYPTP